MSSGLPIIPQDLSNRPPNNQEINSDQMIGNKQITITNEPIITKRAGRRKINIEFIEDKSRRHITFSKRKAGIMKKAYELSTLTGTQVLLLVASETGHVYTFATPKLQPLITKPEGKNLIQACLNAPDTSQAPPSTQSSSSRIPSSSSYQNQNAPSEPSNQMMYHPPDQTGGQSMPMQQHMYDEKPKIAGFNTRGSIGDTKYVQDPNIGNMDNYSSSSSFNAPPNMMNPMRVPYHSGPLAQPRNNSYSMGSPSSNSPSQYPPAQYSGQQGAPYQMPPAMGYHNSPNFHPGAPTGSSPHLFSANQKPGNMQPLTVPLSGAGQHQMNVGGDYKYMPSNNMEGYNFNHR